MLGLVGIIALLGWIYLALFHGRFWQPLWPAAAPAPVQWPSIDIIVPARNEATALPNSLPSLLAQDYPGSWRVILVNDHSTDGTVNVVRNIATNSDRVMVLDAPKLPVGWSGKLAALNAGLTHGTADYVLFTDADIRHPPHSLRELAANALEQKLDLVSLMVKLHCESFAEKLLIPAFVFFFAMLYPFRSANNPGSNVAAAAGGVMLVKRAALDKAGGLEKIKSALIDDCALAKLIKDSGGRIELTLTQEVESLRAYPHIKDVWCMVARTAYTQLRHSVLLLAATVFGMGVLFVAPALLPLTGNLFAVLVGLVAWFAMAALYLPTVLFYRLPSYWALMLPAAAVLYVAATIDSAWLFWQGRGGMWKGRAFRIQGSAFRKDT